ncbi:MAG: RsmB/NOP family class I SAM-dependent RNA methyltransferase [Alphaproteobacteria bacterium]|nr:RsmB/NOP family class I SAM-dependent RNA methyltransferase [Alphaproteobacteria bacterium]MBU1525977.1 RsmB/NOP family class I SAM-dependent RNA methyltransferase [Alphaproteobacteria bacterium]MBU2118368.1 RsmB/NOP family class I SAM-dependent RNA methyltransferase [Alphaproteobacteria bacterium]MBU2350385.1 RsmB/NOP family class I SAM-dependent RNA methyltransferase [Alphaproteobacteria bacterium]MBU2381619.1 RsmB/NOP family class I SAM-dependent RNA methyltransferase [Alphaproteobacteria
MTPSARLAAAASVLDSIAQGRQPAEAVLKAWGAANRYAGSKDRRAVADRVYKVLRARGRLSWIMGGREDGRALVIGSLAALDGLTLEEIEALHAGDGYGPRPLSKQERSRITAGQGELPGWVAAGLPEFVVEDFKATFGDAWADEARELMQPRAPIDLRVNVAKATVEDVEAELREAGLAPERTPGSPVGLRLPSEPPPNVQALEAFKAGRIEIQDEGSQIVCALAGAAPGMTVVDYCAGGGGKTLGLAAAMQGQGILIASDVVARRLENIRPRLARAGVEAELRLIGQNGGGMEDLNGQADLVFVDAPCSGSGTWRRRPEDAWRLTADEVERLHALQVRILSQAAKLVKPGGRLAYVTCSMLSRENEASADAFEAAHPEFAPVGPRRRLSPASTHTDGFFFALYERTP